MVGPTSTPQRAQSADAKASTRRGRSRSKKANKPHHEPQRRSREERHHGHAMRLRQRQATTLVMNPERVRQFLLSDYERWLLKIIRNIQCPDKLFVPPSLELPGPGGVGYDFAFRFLSSGHNPSGISIPPSGTIQANGSNVRNTDHMDGLDNTSSHQLNYITTGGRVLHELTLTGGEGMFVWFDPTDILQPLRVNRGPTDERFWQGSLHGGSSTSPYGTDPNVGGRSETIGWTASPFIFPTNYMPIDNGDTGDGMSAVKCEIYPAADGYDETVPNKAYYVAGCSFMMYPLAVRFVVQEVSTAYTAVSMKARSAEATIAGSAIQRLFNRIEAPGNGAYGYYAAPVQSKCTKLAYRATKWMFPHTYSNTVTPGSLPSMSTSEPAGAAAYPPLGVANWHSLQRALTSDFPMVEIRQVSEGAASNATVTIAVEVDYAISPTSLVSGMASHAGVTMDCPVPEFLSPFQLTGQVYGEGAARLRPPVPGSQIAAAVSGSIAANEAAHAALHEVASYHPSSEIKSIAHSAPSGNGFSRFMETISNGIDNALPVIGKVADVAGKIGNIIAAL